MKTGKVLICMEFSALSSHGQGVGDRLRNLYTYALLPGVWGAGSVMRVIQAKGGGGPTSLGKATLYTVLKSHAIVNPKKRPRLRCARAGDMALAAG